MTHWASGRDPLSAPCFPKAHHPEMRVGSLVLTRTKDRREPQEKKKKKREKIICSLPLPVKIPPSFQLGMTLVARLLGESFTEGYLVREHRSPWLYRSWTNDLPRLPIKNPETRGGRAEVSKEFTAFPANLMRPAS